MPAVGGTPRRNLAPPHHLDLDRQHAHVDQRRPQAAREHPDERAEHAHEQTDRRDDQEPPVRDQLQRPDLVAERQQLLGHPEAEAELSLPVHERTRKPADEGPERRAEEQAEHEA